MPELIGIFSPHLFDLFALLEIGRPQHMNLHTRQECFEPGLRSMMRPHRGGAFRLSHANQIIHGRFILDVVHAEELKFLVKHEPHPWRSGLREIHNRLRNLMHGPETGDEGLRRTAAVPCGRLCILCSGGIFGPWLNDDFRAKVADSLTRLSRLTVCCKTADVIGV